MFKFIFFLCRYIYFNPQFFEEVSQQDCSQYRQNLFILTATEASLNAYSKQRCFFKSNLKFYVTK